jgi:hypothetical protein
VRILFAILAITKSPFFSSCQLPCHLAFIAHAIERIAQYMREPRTLSTDNECDALLATALTFPLPRGALRTQQRSDDKDRIMDPYTCFSAPIMRKFFSSLNSSLQKDLKQDVDMIEKRLPAFPPSLLILDTMPGHNLAHGLYKCTFSNNFSYFFTSR